MAGGRLTEAGHRTNTISVRVSDDELARWEAARAQTPRREKGAWVRAVVEEALSGHPGVPGDVPRVPAVNREVYDELASIGNNLNQLVRYTHQDSELHRDLQQAIRRVGDAALAVRGMRPMDEDDDQEHDGVAGGEAGAVER
ncbi:plasmid mobilization relaxosome protein MobC [Kitasatospora sp. NPDC004723]|uniref:plasmid mobilization relaxosome protein MobC n=1 Tax=Kitasatospora sp. NPDC004723 TaxID=3154288 RepID=UPI0033A172D7